MEKKNAELTIDVLKGQTLISELQDGGAAVDKKAVSKALNDNAVLLPRVFTYTKTIRMRYFIRRASQHLKHVP